MGWGEKTGSGIPKLAGAGKLRNNFLPHFVYFAKEILKRSKKHPGGGEGGKGRRGRGGLKLGVEEMGSEMFRTLESAIFSPSLPQH